MDQVVGDGFPVGERVLSEVNPFTGELVCAVGWSIIDEVVAHVEMLVVAQDESFVGGSVKAEMLMHPFDFV